ncbi:UDP-N-acetylmuramate:L-alanyl-gamma-D-glutamyl-meso-diaminopimelate ligase [Thalassotalea agarivorans]|uniref:UDP-N-acetylmuramate--L-alanyl-gamma-D-glutamyl-meso-2,6-diaminoheptandioate ligase n=1 Tax=Thalassotalea agarivorans TaxID=349064 RepID=A0A1I0GL33_THASX|nr:UDP-N-acetylmuramate:L-alanyl-gamma-D-glutamyl-meso-diaminopimelate ligase [Thalassotalea agarivorans]SET71680.1 UDP-N-acetylmuramate: L-alanyl-gamma-D-glutamyl-meso-diaminopimelate ligase [Thalassotalea agarivorans]
MHIHILGVCGTFMGGIAAIAKSLGFKVSGTDANVYPPMSTQLAQLGIELYQGYDSKHLENDEPDMVIIGNAMSRGNAMVEYVLDRNIPYISGPQWLLEHVLKDRWVVALSGTHGKTTTASMVAWILEYAELSPGYLIGGVPQNFGQSARLGESPFFVIEADEYDTAFFDKRSKFVHYRPRTLVINNLEFDHADIFADLGAIQTQFHHVIRMVPSNGRVIYPPVQSIKQVIDKGIWSEQEVSHGVVSEDEINNGWQAVKTHGNGSAFDVYFDQQKVGHVAWQLIGDFNIENALSAIAATRHAGVTVDIACQALGEFINTKRRLELKGEVNQIKVYDDFAHHPTAISQTLKSVQADKHQGRVIAVLEPRSNTMKLGIHKQALADALAIADYVYLYQGEDVQWSVDDVIADKAKGFATSQLSQLVDKIAKDAMPDDAIVVMSNGGFGAIHDKLLKALAS